MERGGPQGMEREDPEGKTHRRAARAHNGSFGKTVCKQKRPGSQQEVALHQGSAVKYKEGVQDGIISSSHALRKLGRRGGGKGHGVPRKNHICWRGVHPPGALAHSGARPGQQIGSNCALSHALI